MTATPPASRFTPRPRSSQSTGQDGQLRVWSLDGTRRGDAGLGRRGNAVAFSADGKQLLAATDEHVVIFSITAE